jgi:hypothetical protein
MNIMLDLETMGNNSQSPIIAIGAVSFDLDGVSDKFYTQVNLESCVKQGMECDTSTILWWLKQSDDARSAFNNNELSPTINESLINFSNWFSDVGGEQVWGNGAVFDNVILSNAYRKTQLTQPWKFWNDRCYRTVKSIYHDVPFERVGIFHNALDDAESQALHLILVCKKYGIQL